MSQFRVGFAGSIVNGVADWAGYHSQGLRSICVPFAGSGKVIAAMSGADKVIESWDTQVATRGIIEGVFGAKALSSAIREPRFVKGHMYATRSIDGIDALSAGFIDYVGKHGTLADKAAIAGAVARCTTMGRMSDWSAADVSELWRKFQKIRLYLLSYTDLPGQFVHHEANVYELPPSGVYDAIQIDPPKVVSTTDIYSAHYQDLNIALGGACPIPEWKRPDVLTRLNQVMAIPAKKILFMYTSDVFPTIAQVRWLLNQHGEIVREDRFKHRSRYDYCLLVSKE
jgi:hypothetical protein